MSGVLIPAALLAVILLAVGIVLLVSARKAPVGRITRAVQNVIGAVMILGSLYWMWILWQLATGL